MKKAIILLFVLVQSTSGFTQGNWTSISQFAGGKRERAVAFSIGNRGYMGTGQDNFNLVRNDFWEFDPGTNSWTQKANLPADGRRDAVGFAIGNKGYIATGINNSDSYGGTSLDDMWEYDPSSNNWTQKAYYPGAGGFGVYFATAFVIDNKGYVCCGKVFSGYYSSELWQYDPSTDSWVPKTSFPVGERYGISSFSIGQYAYVGMGADHNLFNNDFYRYDPSLDSWQQIASVPIPDKRAFCSGFSLNGKGYLALGDDGGYKGDMWQYNPANDSWTQMNNFPGGARRSAASFVIGKAAYLGTGKGFGGTTRTLWSYTEPDTTTHHVSTAINEIHTSGVSIYPNPFTTSAILKVGDDVYVQNAELKIFDLSGKTVKIIPDINRNEITISRDNLPSGNYIYELSDQNKLIGKGKFSVL